jgi:hypothetical protein
MVHEQKIPWKKRIVDGLKRFSIIVAYLWALLSVFELHKWAVFREQNISDTLLGYRVGFALVNALVLGKVFFIAEDLHLGERFKDKQLIIPVLFKSAMFSVTLVCFYILEEVLVGMWHGKTIAQSIPRLGGGGLEGILIVGIMMFVALIPFFAFKEISRALGEGELKSLLFKRVVKTDVSRSKVA